MMQSLDRTSNNEGKLRMQTANKADENFRKLAELFPDAVTETIDENECGVWSYVMNNEQ